MHPVSNRTMLALATAASLLASAGSAHALLCDRFAPVGIVDTQTALLTVTNILDGKKAAACDVTLKLLDEQGNVVSMMPANVTPGVSSSLVFTHDGARMVVRADVEASGKNPCNLKKAILASFEVFDQASGKSELVLAPYIAPR